MSAEHLLAVFSSPAPGREDEYNAWYSGPHLAEVLDLDGYAAATRFRLAGTQLDGFPTCPNGYLSLYEILGDPQSALERLTNELASGRMVLPDCVDQAGIVAWLFTPITGRVAAPA
jgi:hypothetical protein